MVQESVDTTDVECFDRSLESENDLFLHVGLILSMRYSPLRMRAMPAHHNHHEMSEMQLR